MYKKYLEVGREAVAAAETEIMKWWGKTASDLQSMPKTGDARFTEDFQKSPVTIADTTGEAVIKQYIKLRFPDHGFIGEEEGIEKQDAEYKWIIDPIDGTRAFSRNLPGWAIMLALEYQGEIVVSVIRVPVLDETIYASKGGGTYYNNMQVHVSARGLQESYLTHARVKYFRDQEKLQKFFNLCDSVWYTKSVISREYFRVATGQTDIGVHPSGMYYDNAPLVLLVEEAGGRATTVSGGKFSQDDCSLVVSNGLVHDEILSFFA